MHDNSCYLYSSRFGKMCYYDNKLEKDILLFIHGLSVSKEVFYKQIELLNNQYRIIAIDLLGHGASENATHDHEYVYTVSGFSDVITEFLTSIDAKDVTVYGWSMGGSIAIELLEKYSGIKKILIDSCTPVSYIQNNHRKAYFFNKVARLIIKKFYTYDEAIDCLKKGGIVSTQIHSFQSVQRVIEAFLRANGNMREISFASLMEMKGLSPKECVEKQREKVKILVGEKDPRINLKYLKKHFSDITEIFPNSGHAVFWDNPFSIIKFLLQK
ncbi:alpha/beta fold hydrolase [Fluviispira multicolorata]|uniref:Alpha/beta fold hydrolase n=1 Tax=Fluviispira multicolorata TaxID=2654512 RepID=A0A833JGI0_9BACT|nr:alpha/beta fold hydrolase [Fluviispira multicolorata]KAB8032187.1 alpha/beta fold hydrolase [Fluviispira multicolorata]